MFDERERGNTFLTSAFAKNLKLNNRLQGVIMSIAQKQDKEKLEAIKIDGVEYYTVSQFAILTGKSPSHVMRLTSLGNRIRALKSVKKLNTTLIPKSEVIDYPFVRRGHGEIMEIYHFDKNGNIVYEKYTEEGKNVQEGEIDE